MNSGMRIFGEPYEGDTLPPLNYLLSIILYLDAMTFDGLGKTSGHPVFLTLENLPNWVRNLPEVKVLLEFLPKVQDSEIKTTDVFRSLQLKSIINALILCSDLCWKNPMHYISELRGGR